MERASRKVADRDHSRRGGPVERLGSGAALAITHDHGSIVGNPVRPAAERAARQVAQADHALISRPSKRLMLVRIANQYSRESDDLGAIQAGVEGKVMLVAG